MIIAIMIRTIMMITQPSQPIKSATTIIPIMIMRIMIKMVIKI